MAVTISGGTPKPHNIVSYTAVEDATPLDPGSSTGGAGQVNFTVDDWRLAMRLKGTDIVLSDDEKGRSTGIVRAVSKDGVSAQVTADSELGKFNVRRKADPFSGPIDGLFQYYLDLCGIFTPLDWQADVYTVHAPGFNGVVWDSIKQVLSAHQLEMALVADTVVVRKPRMFEATTNYIIRHETQVETQTSAVAVALNYYNNRSIAKGEVYPVKGEEPSIFSVEANETVEVEIDLNASLSRVYQPVIAEEAGPGNRSGSDGIYTVVGSDNLPIKPQQWIDAGGSLRVEVTEDPSVVKVIIRGADIRHLSPFRIAESAGGHDYNSLHITGDGVAWNMRTLMLYTGADPMNTSDEYGSTVDNPFLSTASQAVFAGQRTAAEYSGSRMRITGSATVVNREDHIKQQVGASLGDADRVLTDNGITTMAQFNAEYTGMTAQDFDQEWRDMYRDIFINQMFGNVNGARMKIEDAYYRIETATISPGTIDYSGVMDTTVADFDTVWSGRTMADFDAAWEEATLDHFSMAPLMEETDDDS